VKNGRKVAKVSRRPVKLPASQNANRWSCASRFCDHTIRFLDDKLYRGNTHCASQVKIRRWSGIDDLAKSGEQHNPTKACMLVFLTLTNIHYLPLVKDGLASVWWRMNKRHFQDKWALSKAHGLR
jgi:hypothetical protein